MTFAPYITNYMINFLLLFSPMRSQKIEQVQRNGKKNHRNLSDKSPICLWIVLQCPSLRGTLVYGGNCKDSIILEMHLNKDVRQIRWLTSARMYSQPWQTVWGECWAEQCLIYATSPFWVSWTEMLGKFCKKLRKWGFFINLFRMKPFSMSSSCVSLIFFLFPSKGRKGRRYDLIDFFLIFYFYFFRSCWSGERGEH